MDNQNKMKLCNQCNILKSINEFYKSNSNSCKICLNKYQQEYRKNNVLKIKIQTKRYYQKNKLKIQAKNKKYEEKNILKIKQRKKEYNLKNKDKINK